MNICICNSFSLSMLPEWVAIGRVNFQRLTLEEAQGFVREGYTSAVGHADVAAIFSQQLCVNVPVNRINASLTPGITEEILVGQHTGPRLPEGATTLPEGAEIQWVLVTFTEDDIEEFSPYTEEEEA